MKDRSGPENRLRFTKKIYTKKPLMSIMIKDFKVEVRI